MRIGVMGTQAKDLVNFRGHLVSEMVKAGHETFGIAPEWTPEIRHALEGLGGTCVPIAMDRTGMNPARELVNAFRLWRVFRRLRLDVLLTYELKSVVFGTLAARLAGVPRRFSMITGRGTTLQGSPSGFQEHLVRGIVRSLYSLALPRTQGVFFQNQDDCDFFGAMGMLPAGVPRRIIAGSGVDLDHFAQAPLPEGPVTFLFVGRLLRNKGLRELVEASRLLRSRQVSFRTRILGPLDTNPNGIKASELDAWVKEGAIEYLGEARDVRPALAQAHAMVLPSYGEGTPRSVLEALSMGRAIVTTDAPGCRETVVEGVNGFMVPVGDVQALADAMERLVKDPSLLARFAQEGRRKAEGTYDVRLVTADILDFMDCSAKGAGTRAGRP
jgi:glycosyltransferase involved in cell wall biosynthesis